MKNYRGGFMSIYRSYISGNFSQRKKVNKIPTSMRHALESTKQIKKTILIKWEKKSLIISKNISRTDMYINGIV